jgi:hypothetical protein
MALFGGERDISLFRHVNRELLGDIITQQCAVYKFKIEETKVNIYGEAAEEKYYMGPVLFNVLIERQDQQFPETDLGTDFSWAIDFKFLRDDLVDAEVVPEVGDIILYEEGYYEVDDVVTNQLFVGKDPRYPNKPNPYENDLDKFGYDVSIICKTHSVPSDKVGISRERLV